MQFEHIVPAKLSDAIVEQLEGFILKGILKPGDKLPAERELAIQMNVSRPSIREALTRIEAKGLIHSRRGEGTFINDLMAQSITSPLAGLLKENPDAMYDVLELRHGLEEMSAWHAAKRATSDDHNLIKKRFKALQQIKAESDLEREAKADTAFHLAIADASHNVALIHVMRSLFDLLHDHIYRALHLLYLRENDYATLHDEHRAIMDAIIRKDPEAAREAAHQHLRHVGTSMRDADRELVRQQDAKKRLLSENL